MPTHAVPSGTLPRSTRDLGRPLRQAVPALPRARVGRPARAPLGVRASLTVKDDQTGVEFLLAQKFWCVCEKN